MEKDKKIQYIHSPDENNFPDREVAELVNVLNNISSACSGIRHGAALALKKIPGTSLIRNAIDSQYWPIEQMCQFRDQGNTIIAKDGARTVGMIGFEEHHKTPNGQRIFEIRRNTVLSDYRGRGIGRTLRESIINRLQEIDPDAILLSRIHKNNETNQSLAGSTQFRKISDEYMKELGFSEDWIQGNKNHGYEFYICNLRNVEKKPTH